MIEHWIGGATTPGIGTRRSPVYDPATGTASDEVVLADETDVTSAVDVATKASIRWAETPLPRRVETMFRLRRLLEDRADELARVVTSQHGKVLADAAGEIARGLENIDYACAATEVLKGSYSPEVATGIDVHTTLEPLGVTVGITPFNFPVMVPLWMAANALVTGNAFVLKPSERDPGPSLLLAELVQQAGVPDGVFNVVQGDAAAVDALITHPGTAAVSFVGSTAVAAQVYRRAGEAGTRVQALGGAKNHMVVAPDADVSVAADAAVSAAFGSAGERCMAVSVLVAVGDVADPLVAAVAERIAAVRIGPGDQPGVEMGPLITAEHRARVEGYVATAAADGARVVVDGREAVVPERGFFLGCSLLDGVRPGSAAYDDEIFGPVLSVVRVDTIDEAIHLVNANRYGNGVAIFTASGAVARRFERAVHVGMVGINVPIPVPVGFHSFGGWKDSRFGAHGVYGPDGMRFYTRQRTVTTRWPDQAAGVDLIFPTTN